MNRRAGLLTVAVAGALAAAGAAFALMSRVSEADCQDACVRPFELSAQTAAGRRDVWEGFPEPQRAQALSVHDTYTASLTKERQAFVSTCMPECVRAASAAQVACYKSAQNIADWKRCAPAK